MTTPSHLAVGLIIGKLTGNYVLAVSTSVLLDCDHFISYARHGKIKSFRKMWRAATNPEDPFADQRGILHNFLAVFLTTTASYFLFSPAIALTIGASHLAHILLDSISDSESWPLRPFSNFRVRGFIPYYSKYEIIPFILFMTVFFLI